MSTNTFTVLATLLLSLTTLPANAQADLDALRSKAGSGDAKAQRTQAFHYRDGTGVAKDEAEALHWAHRAADGGDAEAMDFVGFAYLRGSLIKGNPVIATPGLQLITAVDLKDFWRSDHYGALSKGVLSRPAFVIVQ